MSRGLPGWGGGGGGEDVKASNSSMRTSSLNVLIINSNTMTDHGQLIFKGPPKKIK